MSDDHIDDFDDHCKSLAACIAWLVTDDTEGLLAVLRASACPNCRTQAEGIAKAYAAETN